MGKGKSNSKSTTPKKKPNSKKKLTGSAILSVSSVVIIGGLAAVNTGNILNIIDGVEAIPTSAYNTTGVVESILKEKYTESESPVLASLVQSDSEWQASSVESLSRKETDREEMGDDNIDADGNLSVDETVNNAKEDMLTAQLVFDTVKQVLSTGSLDANGNTRSSVEVSIELANSIHELGILGLTDKDFMVDDVVSGVTVQRFATDEERAAIILSKADALGYMDFDSTAYWKEVEANKKPTPVEDTAPSTGSNTSTNTGTSSSSEDKEMMRQLLKLLTGKDYDVNSLTSSQLSSILASVNGSQSNTNTNTNPSSGTGVSLTYYASTGDVKKDTVLKALESCNIKVTSTIDNDTYDVLSRTISSGGYNDSILTSILDRVGCKYTKGFTDTDKVISVGSSTSREEKLKSLGIELTGTLSDTLSEELDKLLSDSNVKSSAVKEFLEKNKCDFKETDTVEETPTKTAPEGTHYHGQFKATFKCTCSECYDGSTYLGVPEGSGRILADPSYIPVGSIVKTSLTGDRELIVVSGAGIVEGRSIMMFVDDHAVGSSTGTGYPKIYICD